MILAHLNLGSLLELLFNSSFEDAFWKVIAGNLQRAEWLRLQRLSVGSSPNSAISMARHNTVAVDNFQRRVARVPPDNHLRPYHSSWFKKSKQFCLAKAFSSLKTNRPQVNLASYDKEILRKGQRKNVIRSLKREKIVFELWVKLVERRAVWRKARLSERGVLAKWQAHSSSSVCLFASTLYEEPLIIHPPQGGTHSVSAKATSDAGWDHLWAFNCPSTHQLNLN